jgi:hypothetical protein
LPDLRLTAPPDRDQLVRQLLARLSDVLPGLRLVARDLLAAEGRIDFVAVEPNGGVVLVLVAEPGEDLEAVTRALAHRAWVEPRLADWLQLAPDLGVRPEVGVRALLLCHSLDPATVAAAQVLGEAVGLARYRCVRNGSGIEALLELDLSDLETDDEPIAAPPPQAAPPEPGSEPPPFRTGLSDADLGLSVAERREFDLS